MEEFPPGKHAFHLVWVDGWRGDQVRSRLCVRQVKGEGLRDDLFSGGNNRHVFFKYLLAEAVSCKDFGILSVTFLLYSCTLEQMRDFMR